MVYCVCDDGVLIAGTTGSRHIISVGTQKSIVLEFDLEIVYVSCEKEGEM